MNDAGIFVWEDRLTRLTFLVLFLAVAYGLAAGSAVTMYYDITPNMGQIEDSLGPIQFLFYFLAVFLGFIHLPLAAVDIKNKLWKQALIRTAVFISPIIILLGAEGLLAHYLWWNPISDTDRYHMLHHTIVAGAPLTLLFGIGLWRLWQPATFTITPPISNKVWMISGIALFILLLLAGITIGIVPPPVAALLVILSFAALIVFRVRGNK